MLALLALAFAGCGGGNGESGPPLAWKDKPTVITTPRKDRILRGEVTNKSDERVVVEAADLRLLDREGRRVDLAARFIPTFAGSYYPLNSSPVRYPESQRIRLGLVAKLDPGKSVPLTVSWHEPPGPRTPVRVDYGSGSLPIR